MRKRVGRTVVIATLAMTACSGAAPGPSAEAPEDPAATSTPGTELDAVIAAGWSDGRIEVASPTTDTAFLRRVTLDLIGRIPTPSEIRAFEADETPHKRNEVIDALLNGDEYAEHWADVYTDVLLGPDGPGSPKRVRTGTHAWLVAQLEDGVGYDAIVRKILTVRGKLEEIGPAGFLVTHGRKGRVEQVTAETARVFLGVQIGCAQCHDHPYDHRYGQQDFYGLAAYFARTVARPGNPKRDRPPRIIERRRGEAQIPRADGTPGAVVTPAFFGTPDPIDHGRRRREALSASILASDLFAKAAVGRTWAQLMGRGLVEPWDDLGGPGDRHPQALELLADDFAAHDYDIRHLLRTITRSETYQRASQSTGTEPLDATAVFAQGAVRPMSPHQLFRSLLVATGLEDSSRGGFRRAVKRRKRQALREYVFTFGDDEMASADSFSGNVPQALLLLGGGLTTKGVLARSGGTLAAIVERDQDPRDRLDALYLTVLGRHPDRDEAQAHLAALAQRGHATAAWEDLMHAMLLTTEFQTNH